MEDSRASDFSGNLDPRAQEFVPLNPISSGYYFPYNPPPPPLPPSSYGLSPTEPRVFTFFNLPPHPIIFPPPPPPRPPPPRPYFHGVSTVQRLPPPSNSPTRSLSLISVPRDVTETTVRRDLELFGDVRGVQMERISQGIVTVHFYDLRDAKRAVREICGRHMQQQARLGGGGSVSVWSSQSSQARGFVSGRAVWAHFVVPDTSAVPGGCNQGTLVIFNLEPEVSSIALRQTFQVYGTIKELRETPYKKHQRFVEFYDVRDAAKALDRMNGEIIGGKQVVIEFSRPGGHKNKFMSSRQPQLPFQPLQPPLILNPPMRQSVTFMKDKNKNVSPNNGVVAVKDSMRSLCIADDDDNKTLGMQSGTKSKNVADLGKKRQMRNTEISQFLISEETMKDPSCRDPRTTLMIKNIPNKYSQKLLLNTLDNHCFHINEAITEERDEHESHHQPFSSYDFVYLPMDFNNKCNVGYGFVNMTSPEAAWRFYKAFHLQRWEVFNSQKICQVTYARVQGLEDLKEHFKSSKFPCEAELYLPVVFSPPRDGKQLTEPVSININGCNRLDHSHLDPNDGEDHYVSGSCSGSDHDNGQEDGFSGSSIDGGREYLRGRRDVFLGVTL